MTGCDASDACTGRTCNARWRWRLQATQGATRSPTVISVTVLPLHTSDAAGHPNNYTSSPATAAAIAAGTSTCTNALVVPPVPAAAGSGGAAGELVAAACAWPAEAPGWRAAGLWLDSSAALPRGRGGPVRAAVGENVGEVGGVTATQATCQPHSRLTFRQVTVAKASGDGGCMTCSAVCLHTVCHACQAQLVARL